MKPKGPAGRPVPRPGTPATGRIVKLLVGQSYGFIRLRDGREVFFHRGDVEEGTSFNDLKVDDGVAFDLLEDAISGAHAIRVRRRRAARRS